MPVEKLIRKRCACGLKLKEVFQKIDGAMVASLAFLFVFQAQCLSNGVRSKDLKRFWIVSAAEMESSSSGTNQYYRKLTLETIKHQCAPPTTLRQPCESTNLFIILSLRFPSTATVRSTYSEGSNNRKTPATS